MASPSSRTAGGGGLEDLLLDILQRAQVPPLTRLRVSARVARDDPAPVTLRVRLEDAPDTLRRASRVLGPRRRRGVVVDGSGLRLQAGGVVTTLADASQAITTAAHATSAMLGGALAALGAPDMAHTLTRVRLECLSFLRDLDLARVALPVLDELAVLDCPLLARVRVGARLQARSIVVRGNGMLTQVLLDPGTGDGRGLESLDVADNDLADALDVRPRAAALRALRCDNNRLRDLVGLRECAPVLRALHCDCNHLTSLQALTALTALTCLTCTRNSLAGLLDAGPCAALEELWCDENDLTDLRLPALPGLPGLPGLRDLRCGDNMLDALDVRACAASLVALRCDGNVLSVLDVSGCAALTTLTCDLNHLCDILLTGCTALRTLKCALNRLTDLDLSGLPSLEEVDASCNHALQRLTLGQGGASAPPLLRYLTCLHCPLREGVPTLSNTTHETPPTWRL